MTFQGLENARRASQREKFGTLPFYTKQRVDSLLDILDLDSGNISQHSDQRFAFEWNNRVMAAKTSYTIKGPMQPFDFAGTYVDPEQAAADIAIINDDVWTAVDLATRWKVLGDTEAGLKVIDIISAWAIDLDFVVDNNGSATGTLVWSSRWPVLLQAAMMVRDHPAYTTVLDTRLKNTTLRGSFASTAFSHGNNVGMWGVCWEFAAAVFTEDRTRFNNAIARWFDLFDTNVKNNIPIHEIYREGGITNGNGKDGLWYSNFFVQAMVISAEWARYGGVWLYDHKAPDGSTVEGLVKQVRRWSAYPEEYPFNTSTRPTGTIRILPHDDITHALWPNADSQRLMDLFKIGNDRDSSGMRGAVLVYRYRPLQG